jgi:uncharacterized protein (DUF433 family)
MTGGQLSRHGPAEVGRPGPLNDPHYTVPLYQKAEAARIIRVPVSTLRDWADGRVHRKATPRAGAPTVQEPEVVPEPPMSGTGVMGPPRRTLITVADPPTPRGPSIPFVGLTEAYVLTAFRQAGVPMQRIRPALDRLEEEMGLTQALASERLRTDGAEVLWDYGQQTNDPAQKDVVGDLVVVRNGQLVFRQIVREYLRRVTYRDGWARVINVGRGKVDVTVDPWINGGHPTLARRGVAVADVLSRIRAGESSKMVAADYDLRPSEVRTLLELAA